MTNPNLSEGTASAQRILEATGRLTFRENGDANSFAILRDGEWLLSLLHNGRPLVAEQRENLRRLVACWNACAGVSTEWLEAQFSPETEELFGPTRPLDQRLQDALGNLHRALNQRDELVAGLRELVEAERAYREARGGPWVYKNVPHPVQRRVALAWQAIHASLEKIGAPS